MNWSLHLFLSKMEIWFEFFTSPVWECNLLSQYKLLLLLMCTVVCLQCGSSASWTLKREVEKLSLLCESVFYKHSSTTLQLVGRLFFLNWKLDKVCWLASCWLAGHIREFGQEMEGERWKRDRWIKVDSSWELVLVSVCESSFGLEQCACIEANGSFNIYS